MPSGFKTSDFKTNRLELTGISASSGFAIGTLWLEKAQSLPRYIEKHSPHLEADALKQAIQFAALEIGELSANASGPTESILQFQRAVLTDDTFLELALILIKQGQNASQSWNAVLETEVSEYQDARDETFRARALDLQDIQSRVSRILCQNGNEPGFHAAIPRGAIVLADNLTPTAFIAHDWQGGGIALTKSSSASHVAILARQFSVPMVVNLEQPQIWLKGGETVVLDSRDEIGRLILSPLPTDEVIDSPKPALSQAGTKTDLPLATATGKQISLMINLAHLRELEYLDANDSDGIGLVRTEFLFAEQNQDQALADEETQFQAYVRILRWANGKPVYIRTLDGGGDKSVSGFTNTPLRSKLRGIRLSLSRPDEFRVQIRALLRAAAEGNLHVTLPMVSTLDDLNEALALFDDEAKQLRLANITNSLPPIGIMVEVPAVAMTLDLFANAAHFAIGTNDLIQYTLAQPRDIAGKMSGVENPAVISLIKNIVTVGHSLNRPVSICGDAASRPDTISQLLDAGVTIFSISPPSRPLVVKAICAYSHSPEI